MGVRWIDYAIVDPVVAPAGSEAEFSEKLVRLPDCYQPNDRSRTASTAPTRVAAGLPADAFVFCSFNQPFKITREMFALWLDLLEAVPQAVLWLKADNRWATESLRARVDQRGIAPGRVVFGRTMRQPDHLARLRLADLALDCAPCGSHTTASDALWAGVPHIAYLGDTFSARVSASIVSAMGVPELIVRGVDEYRDLALRLARDRAALGVLRARIAANRLTAPLFDSRRFIRHLEAAYQAMWQRCLDGRPPDHIAVVPIDQ
jgi:predicted O-linked N-acetylglucosamine transferase (SPINDLY family)